MMNWIRKLFRLLYPPKCVICAKLLTDPETGLCHSCRCNIQEFPMPHIKLPYLAKWTALWYYEGDVRKSILRFKFRGQKSYAPVYGQLLAMKLLSEGIEFDVLSWVPISRIRRWRRGFDQVKLIADAVAAELEIPVRRTLIKLRNNQPQSGLGDASQRRANVLGVYRCADCDAIRGKRILLLDDILTTGATAGECARVLLSAGAESVICATVAAASHQQKNRR